MKTADFIIIGAQKSGTTALFKFLYKNPEIYLPPQKEVQFFSVPEYFKKGIDWYSKEFYSGISNDIVCGDISPQYMFYDSVPKRIKETLPEVKLIAILRNPVDRAYSHYNMSVRRGQEKRNFIDAFNYSVEQNNQGQESIIESESYYQFSNYKESLAKYCEYFSKDNILILFQEDLTSSPINTLNKIYQFINISEVFYPDNPKEKVHQSGVKKHPKIEQWLLNENVIKTLIKPLIPTKWRAAFRFWIEQINVNPTNNNPLTDKENKFLHWLVIEQNNFLKNEFNLDSPWL